MKFKIDENLPNELIADLRSRGHDADSVHDENLTGAPDPTLMSAATADGRILLTMDKGIADQRQYPTASHAGVVLFRPIRSGRRVVLAFIRQRLEELLQLELQGRLTIVGPTSIRVR